MTDSEQGSPARQSRAKLRVTDIRSGPLAGELIVTLNRDPNRLERAGIELLLRDAVEGGDE